VANGSPAGDTLPVLLAHGTDVLVQSAARGLRTVRFDVFYRGYRDKDLASDELITGFVIDPLPEGAHSAFRKVGTRLAQSISKVMLCGIGTLDSAGRVDSLRLAAGSVAPVPVRLTGAERAGLGGLPAAVAREVVEAAKADVTPIDDVRSSSGYRREVTGRLAGRFVSSLR
jgi:CO/xanthine dehydrogenase FAD-binding subunit